MMIEVLLQPCGRFRWFMIGEDSRLLVFGSYHLTDTEADASAKEYRRQHRALAKIIDEYAH